MLPHFLGVFCLAFRLFSNVWYSVLLPWHFRARHKLIRSSVCLRKGDFSTGQFHCGWSGKQNGSSFVGPFLGGSSLSPEKDPSVFLVEHISPIASVLGIKWCLCVLPGYADHGTYHPSNYLIMYVFTAQCTGRSRHSKVFAERRTGKSSGNTRVLFRIQKLQGSESSTQSIWDSAWNMDQAACLVPSPQTAHSSKCQIPFPQNQSAHRDDKNTAG